MGMMGGHGRGYCVYVVFLGKSGAVMSRNRLGSRVLDVECSMLRCEPLVMFMRLQWGFNVSTWLEFRDWTRVIGERVGGLFRRSAVE